MPYETDTTLPLWRVDGTPDATDDPETLFQGEPDGEKTVHKYVYDKTVIATKTTDIDIQDAP